ncbi:Mpo1-like protein [Kordiimonas sp.]|uniref:Mpo1-like protein n=1 Tax=Kordiimonas sp. TaxID=1970157 RepID=UPI003A931CF0
MAPKFESFREFFPYYLAEHSDPVCRGLHYAGTMLATAVFLYALYSQTWWLLLVYPVIGYGFAWAGHFIFEKNKPATFDYAWWSLLGDYKMLSLWLTGRLAPAMEDALAKFGRRNSKGVSGAA